MLKINIFRGDVSGISAINKSTGSRSPYALFCILLSARVPYTSMSAKSTSTLRPKNSLGLDLDGSYGGPHGGHVTQIALLCHLCY